MNNEKKMRVLDNELAMLNAVFAENDDLLVAVRNVFFDIANSEDEKFVADAFAGKKELLALMRKMFLPELSREIPLGQTVDLWLTVDVKERDEAETVSQVQSRNALIGFIEKSLKLLDGATEKVDLSINPKKITKSEILARNNFIQHVEAVLLQIRVLAGMKNETAEQVKE